ncbi:MAG: hypothetical protein NC181_04505, partial [Clostridium sp.]|nr:hypothetical protein [Clostridium sp.]MCM1444564.1 hypothetical protein [Candidatus Amulumruptor caecigallinarius]
YMSKEEDERKIFNSRMSEATRKGLEKGIEEGIKEGKQEEKLEIARNMINNGFDIKTISKITKLSINEIEKLNEFK